MHAETKKKNKNLKEESEKEDIEVGRAEQCIKIVMRLVSH